MLQLIQVRFRSDKCPRYENLSRNAIVRLSHPCTGDSHSQETFLAPPADKKTHPRPSHSAQTTIPPSHHK